MKKLLLSLMVVTCASLSIAHPAHYNLTEVVKRQEDVRLTTKWALVIDTSSSMEQDRVEKAHYAFLKVTQFPVDELKFCMYTFNDSGVDRYRPWKGASPVEFRNAHKWANKPWQRGTLSKGVVAIKKALHQPVHNLTVIIISDGGFTEGIAAVKTAIAESQHWRKVSGYGKALIVTIGIQNLYYYAGGKLSDPVCQRGMKEIGSQGEGGYYFVHTGRFRSSMVAPPPEKVTTLQKAKEKIKKAYRSPPPSPSLNVVPSLKHSLDSRRTH